MKTCKQTFLLRSLMKLTPCPRHRTNPPRTKQSKAATRLQQRTLTSRLPSGQPPPEGPRPPPEGPRPPPEGPRPHPEGPRPPPSSSRATVALAKHFAVDNSQTVNQTYQTDGLSPRADDDKRQDQVCDLRQRQSLDQEINPGD